MPVTTPNSNSCSTGSCCPLTKWMLPLMLVILLGGILTSRQRPLPTPLEGTPVRTSAWSPTPVPEGPTVRLEIDFGNGCQQVFASLPWQEGMTVAQVLAAARDWHPGLEFTQTGQGAGGLLVSLEGLKNEGRSGRNWLFEVANHPGNQSFCLQTVGAGELVRWRFAAQSPEQ